MKVYRFQIPGNNFVGSAKEYVHLGSDHVYFVGAPDIDQAKLVATGYLGEWFDASSEFSANSKSVADFLAYEHERVRPSDPNEPWMNRIARRLEDDLGSIELENFIVRISVGDGEIITEMRIVAKEGDRRRVIYDTPMKTLGDIEYLDLLSLIQDYF